MGRGFLGDEWVQYDLYADNFYDHALAGGEQRILHPLESPEAWSEDLGAARW